MASAGPSGSSRDSPMTRMRISVSSRMGTSEHSRRKKLGADEELGWAGLGRAVPGPQMTPCTKCHRPEGAAARPLPW